MNTEAIQKIPTMATCDTKKNSENANIPNDEQENRKDPVQLGLALLGLAVIGTGSVVYAKNKLDLQGILGDSIQILSGNNKTFTSAAQESKDAAEKFIEKYKDLYEGLKQYASKVIRNREASENSLLFHGTSIENAASILQSGITPYASKEDGSKLTGKCIHMSSNARTARLHSNDGIVLPYRFKGNAAEFVQGTDIKDFQKNIFTKICRQVGLANNENNISYSQKTVNEAYEMTSNIITKLIQDMGYDCLYYVENPLEKAAKATSKASVNNKLLEEIAIYDGTKLTLAMDKLKEINPTTDVQRFVS